MSRRSDKEEAAHLQYETEHTAPPKSQSVIPYLVILIVAAFLLLALAYFQQRRVNSETTDALKQSTSAVQSIQNLIAENDLLQGQVDELEKSLSEVRETLAQVQAEAGESSSALAREQEKVDALNMLNQLRALYNARRYSDARALAASWSGTDMSLEEALGEVNASLAPEELENYDPLAAYQRLSRLLSID